MGHKLRQGTHRAALQHAQAHVHERRLAPCMDAHQGSQQPAPGRHQPRSLLWRQLQPSLLGHTTRHWSIMHHTQWVGISSHKISSRSCPECSVSAAQARLGQLHRIAGRQAQGQICRMGEHWQGSQEGGGWGLAKVSPLLQVPAQQGSDIFQAAAKSNRWSVHGTHQQGSPEGGGGGLAQGGSFLQVPAQQGPAPLGEHGCPVLRCSLQLGRPVSMACSTLDACQTCRCTADVNCKGSLLMQAARSLAGACNRRRSAP